MRIRAGFCAPGRRSGCSRAAVKATVLEPPRLSAQARCQPAARFDSFRSGPAFADAICSGRRAGSERRCVGTADLSHAPKAGQEATGPISLRPATIALLEHKDVDAVIVAL
jgi:hypothetical protein